MKRILLFAACFLMSCGSEPVFRYVTPLAAGYSVDSMYNVFVPARFASSDFDWKDGKLTMEAFSEDIYDMVDVTQLSFGDTILYMGDKIVVDSLCRDGDCLEINGGLGDNNGAWLEPYEGGTWRAIQFDDHSVYTSVGKVSLPLSQSFTIVDCGEQFTDPSDTISIDQQRYIETLAGGKSQFTELNTKVLVEDGRITAIVRRWIP